jgi:hypothetical protein
MLLAAVGELMRSQAWLGRAQGQSSSSSSSILVPLHPWRATPQTLGQGPCSAEFRYSSRLGAALLPIEDEDDWPWAFRPTTRIVLATPGAPTQKRSAQRADLVIEIVGAGDGPGNLGSKKISVTGPKAMNRGSDCS